MLILKCILFLASISIIGFISGRMLASFRFNASAFPFRLFEFERSGKLYDNLHIKKWQNRLPDMSRIFVRLMPAKYLSECTDSKLSAMINETCIAELTHIILALAGFLCIVICRGAFSVICSVLYFIGNIPFIIIQRYNRPRLIRLQQKAMQGREKQLCERSY